MSKSKSESGRREGARSGNSLSPSVAALRQKAAFIEMLRADSKRAQLVVFVELSGRHTKVAQKEQFDLGSGKLPLHFGNLSSGSARKSPTRRAGTQRAYLKHKLREILQARG
jgi:hypothetical protein